MKVVPLRLQPGDDLRSALEAWMDQQEEQAGCVISAVGSLSVAELLFAGATKATVIHGNLEILSLCVSRVKPLGRRFASTTCYQKRLSLGNTAVSSPRPVAWPWASACPEVRAHHLNVPGNGYPAQRSLLMHH